MPHIIVKMYPGRSEEQKKLLTERITKEAMEVLGVEEKTLSIAFEEIPREKWNEEVYQPDIIQKESALYKKPGYRPE